MSITSLTSSIRLTRSGSTTDVFRALDRGKLDADAFFSGKGVKAGADDEDRVVYDTKSGSLYYDKDGLGGAKAIKFAILDGSPDNVGSSDFLVLA